MSLGTLAVVAALVGLQAPTAGADLDDAKLRMSIAQVVAIPEGGKVVHIGTGFLFDSEGSRRRLMTVAHLVKDAAGVRVDFPGRQRFHAVRVWIDRSHDLAMLELNADAPSGAVPLRGYDGPEPSDELKVGLRIAGYIQGYPRSTLRPAKLENRFKASEVRAHGKASEECLDADAELYQLHGDFSDGGSGSPIVDRSGQVLGVYQGGPMHGALSLNFCVPYFELPGVVRLQPRKMMLVGNAIDQMSDLVISGLIESESQGLSGTLPSQFVIKRLIRDAILKDFVPDVRGQEREAILKDLDAVLDHGKRQINHVINTRVGVGFLVPEGFELKEGFDDETQAATLTVHRPGSDYTVRYYSRPIALPKMDSAGEHDGFRRESLKFLSRVLKLQITPPGMPPAQPGQGTIVSKPFSWPGAYRDSFADDLVSFRTYYEGAQDLLHAYAFEMCRRASRVQISGLSAPATAFAEDQPSDELVELFFILSSSYDTQLGLELSKHLHTMPGRTLTRAFNLPTPPPATAPPEGMPAVKVYSPFPPAPDDKGAVHAEATADGAAIGGVALRPGGDNNVEPVMLRASAPAAVRARTPKPLRRVYTAPNLGITFSMVRLPNGRLGAQLEEMPAPGSPAANVVLGGNIPGFLTPGDIILSLNGIAITEPNSPLKHFGPTWIDFIDGPTGQLMRGFTVVPRDDR